MAEPSSSQEYIVIDEVASENDQEDCILIENKNITTITLEDSVVEYGSEDGELNSDSNEAKDKIDLTACSQEENSPEGIAVLSDESVLDTTSQNESAPKTRSEKNITLSFDLNDTLASSECSAGKEEQTRENLIEIKFSNNKIYLQLQEEFLEIIQKHFKNRLDDLEIIDTMRYINVREKVVQKSDMFKIDLIPTPNQNNSRTQKDFTPAYKKNFSKVFLSGEDNGMSDSNLDSALKMCRPKAICFNCGKSNHQLRDCPEKRDARKIKLARDSFGKKHERYHEGADNKFGHFIPGIMTPQLKAALGIADDELPLHIYRMRLLGYPQAWLEEAKIENSGISLFDSKGKRVLDSDEDEGEVDAVKDQYDLKKIFDYPGFNVVPEFSYKEIHQYVNCPPMMVHNSKERLLQTLQGSLIDGYKRKKQKITHVDEDEVKTIPNITSLTNAEMDIDSGEDMAIMPLGITVCNSTNQPLPTSTPVILKTIEVVDEELCEISNIHSPSIADLNEKRKVLLAEIGNSSVFLETSSINTTVASVDDTLIGEILEMEQTVEEKDADTTLQASTVSEIIIENSVNENIENSTKDVIVPATTETKPTTIEVVTQSVDAPPLPPSDPSTSQDKPAEPTEDPSVTSTVLGTPLLKFSPFESLPSGDKFALGICHHINFENLPDSTGKYEKMKTLLKKVRTQVTDLNQD